MASALGRYTRLLSNHQICNWPSRSDHHQLFPKVIFSFQISSAIFFLASTNPLALVSVTILDWKQSRHFSSFADLLGIFDITKFLYAKNQVRLIQIIRYSGSPLVCLGVNIGNRQKSPKFKVLIPSFYTTFLLLFWQENLIELSQI